jgi:hypothetical protein
LADKRALGAPALAVPRPIPLVAVEVENLHAVNVPNLRRREAYVVLGRSVSSVDIPERWPADGVDVAWLLRTIRSVAPHNVEDGQRIEIARMQQLLAERD